MAAEARSDGEGRRIHVNLSSFAKPRESTTHNTDPDTLRRFLGLLQLTYRFAMSFHQMLLHVQAVVVLPTEYALDNTHCTRRPSSYFLSWQHIGTSSGSFLFHLFWRRFLNDLIRWPYLGGSHFGVLRSLARAFSSTTHQTFCCSNEAWQTLKYPRLFNVHSAVNARCHHV